MILSVSNIRVMGKPITHKDMLQKFGDRLQKVRKAKDRNLGRYGGVQLDSVE
jgi:hypothetical protein